MTERQYYHPCPTLAPLILTWFENYKSITLQHKENEGQKGWHLSKFGFQQRCQHKFEGLRTRIQIRPFFRLHLHLTQDCNSCVTNDRLLIKFTIKGGSLNLRLRNFLIIVGMMMITRIIGPRWQSQEDDVDCNYHHYHHHHNYHHFYVIIFLDHFIRFWEAAHLPLPYAYIYTYFSLRTNVGLGEGWLGSFLETYNDPITSYPFLLAGEAQPAKRKSDAVLHEDATTSSRKDDEDKITMVFLFIHFSAERFTPK